MKCTIALLIAFFTASAFSAVVKSTDAQNGCDLYQAVQEDSNGRIVLAPGQALVSSKRVYGLSFLDMEVDFDRQEVLVQTTMNVVMGLNRELMQGKSSIKKDNADFNFLINQLNRKLSLFEKICITSKNEIMYAKFFPAPPESK
jgi:hypothetical protein